MEGRFGKIIHASVTATVLGGLSLISCSSTRSTNLTDVHDAVEWNLADLTSPGATGVTKVGDPRQIDCPYGRAVEFDGKGDALFLDTDPLLHLHQFTIEIIFRPDPNAPAEQRFLQMGEVNGERMMMETRVTPDNQWYFDAFIRSGDSSRTLVDNTKLHPTATWHHAAFVVDRGAMETYVDGKRELQGSVQFTPLTKGTTSIGVRMNRLYWFKGAIHKIKITPTKLGPSDFLKF